MLWLNSAAVTGVLCFPKKLRYIPNKRRNRRPGGFDNEPETEIGGRGASDASAGLEIADVSCGIDVKKDDRIDITAPILTD